MCTDTIEAPAGHTEEQAVRQAQLVLINEAFCICWWLPNKICLSLFFHLIWILKWLLRNQEDLNILTKQLSVCVHCRHFTVQHHQLTFPGTTLGHIPRHSTSGIWSYTAAPHKAFCQVLDQNGDPKFFYGLSLKWIDKVKVFIWILFYLWIISLLNKLLNGVTTHHTQYYTHCCSFKPYQTSIRFLQDQNPNCGSLSQV